MFCLFDVYAHIVLPRSLHHRRIVTDFYGSPPARGFFRRMGTRVLAQPSPDKYKAVKMPRGDYARYFRHDARGHYVGTEPEREWDEEEIMEKYGQYQDLPLRSILGRTTPHDTPLALPWGA